MNQLKIAIVCDWLVTYAGAEKLLSQILTCFPHADLFSLIDFLSPEDRLQLANKKARTTFIQKLPFAKKNYRYYLPLMPLAIEQLDVSQYDVVISSSHAVAKGIITGPDQVHICCTLSPIRYAWDLQHQYLQELSGIKSYLARYFLHKMRIWDYRTANNVDHFIAISHFIARRIWKIYRREASVIYPPVDTQLFIPGGTKEDFYLTASRMVPYKKIDLIVDSFASMPDKKLIVIGDGPDFLKIKKKATKNIEILGFQPTETLIHYMQKAKAFVFAAEEDFGIAPLEAQACGTPVIAYGKGAVLETIRGLNHDNPTGIFFNEQSVSSINRAVHDFEKINFSIESCVNNSARFSVALFQQLFKEFVSQKVQHRND